MQFLQTLAGILSNAYIYYMLALGVWAGWLAIKDQPLGGNFFGAMWISSVLAGLSLLLGIVRVFNGAEFRAVFWLYELYFILVMPGVFALLKGRDDRQAAWFFAGVAIFSALASLSTLQRNVVLNDAALLLPLLPLL